MNEKKLNILMTILMVMFYVLWTASIVILYIEVFAKGHNSTFMVFVLGFSQASWIYSIINTIGSYIRNKLEEQEESNITITINNKTD